MWTTRSIQYASIEPCLSGMNPLRVSKFKSRDYVSEFQKASNLMQAQLTLKGKVKKIRRCPVNQLKLFDVQ